VTLPSFRERLHDGVIRDVQRQQRRKTENMYLLQQQIELTKQLKRSEEEQLQMGEGVR
jgi:protein PET117